MNFPSSAEELKKLIAEKPDYLRNRTGYHPLHNAISTNNAELVQIMLENNADLVAEDDSGRMPLLFALEKGMTNVCEIIITALKKKSNWLRLACDSKDKRGRSCFHFAVAYPQILSSLLDSDADINTKQDSTEFTPLMFAAYQNQPESIKLLLQKGAVAKESNKKGKTALMLACEEGNTECIKNLLDFDKDLSLQVDNEGNTAAHWAFMMGHEEDGKVLLEACPEVQSIKNNTEQTPEAMLALNEELEIEEEDDQFAKERELLEKLPEILNNAPKTREEHDDYFLKMLDSLLESNNDDPRVSYLKKEVFPFLSKALCYLMRDIEGHLGEDLNTKNYKRKVTRERAKYGEATVPEWNPIRTLAAYLMNNNPKKSN
eukprot:TRINITY_DN10067_c0_g1_i1.p1 TRINITY_DN10067_c0_g1~~TRINITY_DN10067_c0_g1_i1.p1  ORF type:complete len:374 (+),score=115.68 TRINITY_DN10067_c0_g1_i1:114-1235(+)